MLLAVVSGDTWYTRRHGFAYPQQAKNVAAVGRKTIISNHAATALVQYFTQFL